MELKITAISLIFIIFAVLSLSFFMDNVSIKEGALFNIPRISTITTKPATTTPAPTTTRPATASTTTRPATTTPVPTTTKPATTTPVPTTTTPVPTNYCTNKKIPDAPSYYSCNNEVCQYTFVANDIYC